ncbi:MAG TPA: UPF0182 family protein [Nocardioidaceae bacterium]|nr:UPF0182 family protein [Nocardioidaceae bacterium]
MSGFFEGDDPPARARRPGIAASRRPRVLIGTAVVLVLAFFLLSVFDGIWTDRLWFGSIGYPQVFSTVLTTRVLLFVVFGILMGAFVALNIALAYRYRPLFRPASSEQASLDRYRTVILPLRRWLLIGIGVLVGVFAGASGASQWRQFLLWRHQVPFGKTDPFFGKDIGFFVFTLPWLHYLVNFGMAATFVALIASAVVHYLFGGIRLQVKRDKLSGAAQAQISALLGLFVLFKSADYWLDRYDLDTAHGSRFTGMGYTDYHAVLPSKNILTFIALICAVLFFANVFRRTWMLPTIGLGLLALSAILLGALWPGIVQQFQVGPSEPDKEAPYIAKNIEATRQAYGVADAKVIPYNAKLKLSPTQLEHDPSIPSVRLLDPALESTTFDQLQQVRGYYSVPQVLDVDRYNINGRERDLVIATRELNQAGIPAAQRNWTNLHTVYTHGFGVIAAFGNQRDVDNQPDVNGGEPVWAEQDIPPQGYLSRMSPSGFQPRIYFGENSPSYSIVGKVSGGRSVELDIPEQTASGSPRTNTYTGAAGVPVGGLFNKLLYAVKFGEPNIVLSNRVNSNSRILYNRDPRLRLEQVAPWLTVDGDPYPAVVNGHVDWILDGYTTTDRYPMSQLRSLSDMTSDSLNPRTSYATLPSDQLNYMRNSVKAVVDAYTGKVTLYNWDNDPILRAWAGAFPGVVKSRSQIPPTLLAHMRYPEDLFKVQRNILAQYHVTKPQPFYNGTDLWKVPEDPAVAGQTQPPYRLSVTMPGTGATPRFSLTSDYVPYKRQNLAAFIAVDSDASNPSDYGQLRILRLPGSNQIPGPGQIANTFAADPAIQQKLLPYQKTSKVRYGNLLTLPVGGGLLYVQPVYTLRQTGAGSYPVLRYVLASFGQKVGFGSTLNAALDDVLGTSIFGGQPGGGPAPSGGPIPPGTSETVTQLLQQAQAKFEQAQAALKRGDLQGYAAAEAAAQSLVKQALQAAEAGSPNVPSPAPSPSASPSPTSSPASPKASPSSSSSPLG